MKPFTYFEPLIDGHCAFLAKLVLPAAAGDPRISRVNFVAGQDLVDRLEVVDSRISVIPISQEMLTKMRSGKLLTRGHAQWSAACRLGADYGGEVFLPFFDHAVVAAALSLGRGAAPGRVSGIIFRPPNQFGHSMNLARKLDSARRWMIYTIAKGRSVGKLLTFDEVAANSRICRLTRTLQFLPDPAPEHSLLEGLSRLPRADGRSIALLFGALTARKGLFEIVEAWVLQQDEWLESRVLRLVGNLGREDRVPFKKRLSELRRTRPVAKIELVDSFVADTALAQEIVDADLILAPYQNHVGSSGVLFWASAAGKPLLTQNTGLLGYQTLKYGLGRTVDCTDVGELGAALAETWEQGAVDLKFLLRHSPASTLRSLMDGLLSGVAL